VLVLSAQEEAVDLSINDDGVASTEVFHLEGQFMRFKADGLS